MISCIPCRLKYKSDEGRRSVWITGIVYIPGYPTEVRRWAVMFTYVYMISPVYNCIYGNALSLLYILNFEYQFPELWVPVLRTLSTSSLNFGTCKFWTLYSNQIWMIYKSFSNHFGIIYKWIWNQTVSEYSRMLKYSSISIISNYNDSTRNHCSSLYQDG